MNKGQVIFVPDPSYVPPPPPASPPEKAKLPESIIKELHTLEEPENSPSITTAQTNTSQGFNIFKVSLFHLQKKLINLNVTLGDNLLNSLN